MFCLKRLFCIRLQNIQLFRNCKGDVSIQIYGDNEFKFERALSILNFLRGPLRTFLKNIIIVIYILFCHVTVFTMIKYRRQRHQQNKSTTYNNIDKGHPHIWGTCKSQPTVSVTHFFLPPTLPLSVTIHAICQDSPCPSSFHAVILII